MDLIGIPTDNLYKFCAILGLTLFVFNTYYTTEMSYKSQEEAIKAKGDSELAKANDKDLEANLETVKAEYNKAEVQADYCILRLEMKENKRENFKNDAKMKIEFEQLIINLNEQASKTQDVLRDLFYEKTKIMQNRIIGKYEQQKQKELQLLSEKKRYEYNIYLYLGDIIGLIISIWGFRKWYFIEKKETK